MFHCSTVGNRSYSLCLPLPLPREHCRFLYSATSTFYHLLQPAVEVCGIFSVTVTAWNRRTTHTHTSWADPGGFAGSFLRHRCAIDRQHSSHDRITSQRDGDHNLRPGFRSQYPRLYLTGFQQTLARGANSHHPNGAKARVLWAIVRALLGDLDTRDGVL